MRSLTDDPPRTLRELILVLQLCEQREPWLKDMARHGALKHPSVARIETVCLTTGKSFTVEGVERLFAETALARGQTLIDMLALDIAAAAAALDVMPVPATAVDDDSPWVQAHTLWPAHFTTIKEVAKFRTQHPKMFRNPSRNRLEIHAAKWAAFWAARDKDGFDAMDGNLRSIADNHDVQDEALSRAMQRMAEARAKKQAGK
jgi:hypothetical protein